MADFDVQSLFSDPLFLGGVSGLLANPQDRASALLRGMQTGQQMQGQQQLAALNALKLKQAQAQANFNPADYMQTTPSAGVATPTAQLQQSQAPTMPSTLGGPLSGGMQPLQQPTPDQLQQAPIPAPTPGAPTGRIDMQGLLGGGLQAGMSPAEVQQIAGVMDPQTAAQTALASKFEKLSPGEVGFNGLGHQVAANTNAPINQTMQAFQQALAARNAAQPGSPEYAAADSLVQKLSGSAEQANQQAERQQRDRALGIAQQNADSHALQAGGDPASIETTAQAIANKQLPALSGYAMKTPQGQKVMARVMELNPQYNAQDYQTAQKTMNDFAGGGKNGNTVRAMSVSIDHLGTLAQAGAELQNGNTPMFNQLANAIAVQTGKPAPTNFDGIKHIVAAEVAKAVVGGATALGDRDKIEKEINSSSGADQLNGLIQKYQQLLGGQLKGLGRQYQQGSGRDDFSRFLSPSANALMNDEKPKTIVRTGTSNGRKVVQYSDGSTAFAD